MAWVSLILAGLFEMFGVAMINKLHKDRNWQSLVLLIHRIWGKFFISCLFHENFTDGNSLCDLDRNRCIGGAIIGMLLYGESKDWNRVVFIAMVFGAAVGLKLVS